MILTDCETFKSINVLLLLAREYRIISKLRTKLQEMFSYVLNIKISYKIVFNFERIRAFDCLKLKNISK
jgi:hypothetical protein